MIDWYTLLTTFAFYILLVVIGIILGGGYWYFKGHNDGFWYGAKVCRDLIKEIGCLDDTP